VQNFGNDPHLNDVYDRDAFRASTYPAKMIRRPRRDEVEEFLKAA
jgi:hypothetical protein